MVSAKKTGLIALEMIMDRFEPIYRVESVEEVDGSRWSLLMAYDSGFIDTVKGKKRMNEMRAGFFKLHNCALTYGYRGVSQQKKNGIVNIKPSDIRLLDMYKRTLTKEVMERHGLEANPIPVKVVAHVANGDRLVAAINREAKKGYHKMVVLGFGNYNKKPGVKNS